MLGNILENSTQIVTHCVIVVVLTKCLDCDLVKTPFVEQLPGFVTRPAVLERHVIDNGIEDTGNSTVFYQVLMFHRADILSNQSVTFQITLELIYAVIAFFFLYFFDYVEPYLGHLSSKGIS